MEYSFVGNTGVKIDDSGRLVVPAQFRKQLERNGELLLVLRKNPSSDYLDIYPKSEWDKEMEIISGKLNLLNRKEYDAYMRYTATGKLLEIDKNGRILLSKDIQESIHIEGGDAYFVGATKKIAIWAKAEFENFISEDSEEAIGLDELLQEKLSNKE